jgi:hypothetical protein
MDDDAILAAILAVIARQQNVDRWCDQQCAYCGVMRSGHVFLGIRASR